VITGFNAPSEHGAAGVTSYWSLGGHSAADIEKPIADDRVLSIDVDDLRWREAVEVRRRSMCIGADVLAIYQVAKLQLGQLFG
jgi:hypothetical protein